MIGSEDKARNDEACSQFRQERNGESPALVSVVVPAFNAAGVIRQTLDSVVAQTYKNLEVIVVDDGSSDNTSPIAEEFVKKDPRFQLVRQSNQGVGDAQNTAIRMARGKYIAPLDADDLWFPEKIEKQVACIERCGPETGLVYCWSKFIDEHGAPAGPGITCKFKGRLHRLMILSDIIGNGSVPLFRAAALQKIGLNLTRAEQGGGQGCEDWDLALRVAEEFDYGVVPEYLVAYRQMSHSVSVSTRNMVKSYTEVMARARQRNRHLPSSLFRWSAGYFYLFLANKCFALGAYSRCLVHLKDAALANPFFLLRTDLYRNLLKCLRGLAAGQSRGHRAEPVQPSPEKQDNEPVAFSMRERKRGFISNRIFRRIELNRWSAARHDRV
jgi:glycosyltransferase involved in cell wall biosynthesis